MCNAKSLAVIALYQRHTETIRKVVGVNQISQRPDCQWLSGAARGLQILRDGLPKWLVASSLCSIPRSEIFSFE